MHNKRAGYIPSVLGPVASVLFLLRGMRAVTFLSWPQSIKLTAAFSTTAATRVVAHTALRTGSITVFGPLMAATKSASFKTLAGPAEYEEIIKKSRFLSRATPASSFAEAQTFLRDVGDLKASHNCWAWRGHGEERSSDDGEPGGTAGRPILSAIESEDLVDVMVVVTRYFGGIKLGAGGLVRAYGGVARTCLRNAETLTHIPKVLVRLRAPLSMSGAVFQTINRTDKIKEDYTAEEIIVDVKVDAALIDNLRQQLQDATRGSGSLEEC